MPYNVERILLMASKMDTKRVQKIMTEFENSQENGTKIPVDILSAIQSVVVGKFSRKKSFFCRHSVLKSKNKCNFGNSQYLSQRLKLTCFEIFLIEWH